MKEQHYKLIFWGFVLLTFVLACISCNPVKKVLKDPAKTQQVFDEGVKRGWCVNDSVYVSDTTILLDTLHVIESATDTLKVDSVVYITKTDYKTITKTVTIRDTTVVTDNTRINLLQKKLSECIGALDESNKMLEKAAKEIKQARKERNKWRLYFWLAVFGLLAFLTRKYWLGAAGKLLSLLGKALSFLK